MEKDNRANIKEALEKLAYNLAHGHTSRVEQILSNRLSYIYMCKPQSSKPVLYELARNPDEVSTLTMLQKFAELKVNFSTPNNWGLIMQLATEGKNSCVKELIERQGIPSTVTDPKGNSLLHVAALVNSRELVQYLLQRKVAPHIQNSSGQMAVDVAIRFGNTAAVKILFEASTDAPYRERLEQNLIQNFPVALQSALMDIHQFVNPEARYPYEVREAVFGKGGKGTFSKSGGKYTSNSIATFLQNGKSDKLARKQQLLRMLDELEYCEYGHLIYNLEDEEAQSLQSVCLQLENTPNNEVTPLMCTEIIQKTAKMIGERVNQLPSSEKMNAIFSQIIDTHLKTILSNSTVLTQ